MTDLTSGRDQSSTSRAGMDYTPPPRTGAFRAAGRHTARVRFLRRLIVLGAVFGVSVIAVIAAFDPFRHLPHGVSIAGVGVDGTKITLDNPKLTGVQQGGGRYRIEAKSGIQDITKPSIIELVGIDADIGMADRTKTRVVARHGVYDGKRDSMSLDGQIKISNTSGYTLTLQSMHLDFKRGILASQERTRVDLKGGDVRADKMLIANNGHTINFEGHVQSTFEATDDEAGTATAQASSGEASDEVVR